MRRRNILILILVVLAAVLVGGYYLRHHQLDVLADKLVTTKDTFSSIKPGDSLDEVRGKLELAAHHEFTITSDNANYTLISCGVKGARGLPFWLLFRDNKLLKVIAQMPFPELWITGAEEKWSIDDPAILQRVQKVINASALTEAETLDYFKPEKDGMSGLSLYDKFQVDCAMMIMGIAQEKDVSAMEDAYKFNNELAARYDGSMANLAMTTEAVKKLYGEPAKIITAKNGDIAFLYGTNINPEVNNPLAFNGIAVVMDPNGHVKSIYSHNFFNDRWLSDESFDFSHPQKKQPPSSSVFPFITPAKSP